MIASFLVGFVAGAFCLAGVVGLVAALAFAALRQLAALILSTVSDWVAHAL